MSSPNGRVSKSPLKSSEPFNPRKSAIPQQMAFCNLFILIFLELLPSPDKNNMDRRISSEVALTFDSDSLLSLL